MTQCPACASPSSRRWGSDQQEPILACLGCGTTYFARPIVQPVDYETYYPYLHYFDHARFKWELAQRRRRFVFQLREIERLGPPGRTLLDFGSAVGYFCAIAGEAGWDASGVEASQPAIEVGVREFAVRYTSLDAVRAGSCSVVTAFHVLEHLDSPLGTLQAFREKLVPRGILAVHVPNQESMSQLLRHRLKTLLKRPDPRQGSLYYPEHITGFTPAGLATCAATAGFDLICSRQASPLSPFHDPWFIRNYFHEHDIRSLRPRPGGVGDLAKKLAFGLIDHVGGWAGRGDWLVAHFRAR